MPDRRIAYIRLHETHDGDHLIRADRRKIKISTELLNGIVPGFRVDYGAGLERFFPAQNVMSAELEHTSTKDTLALTQEMLDMIQQLQDTRANIKTVTVKSLKAQIDKARKLTESAATLYAELPKEGQISKDRKALMDATHLAIKLGAELEGLIPKAEDKPKG